MELIKPCMEYQQSYIRALKDGYYLGSAKALSNDDIAEIEQDFARYLERKFLKPYDPTPKLRNDGKYYANVPQIPFWLVDNGEFIGGFDLRTSLNDFLMYAGGNVGYGITPKYRRRGYATKGLALLIDEAKKLKMQKLLIAAKESNIGSWKAIENNGGILENVVTLPWDESAIKYKRYWIDLE